MKIKLTDEIKGLSRVPLDPNAFEVPELITLDFTTALPIYVYDDGVRTDIVRYYIIKGVDDKVHHALKELGLDFSCMPHFNVYLWGNLDEITEAKALKKVVNVKLPNPKVRLGHIQSPIYSNRWAYSLVAQGLSFLP